MHYKHSKCHISNSINTCHVTMSSNDNAFFPSIDDIDNETFDINLNYLYFFLLICNNAINGI